MAGGRPSKYFSNVEPKLLLIEAWARDGLTDEQIAANLEVAYSTFRTYKDDYPALSAALKNGKEVIDIMVENALLKAALGYQYEETKETEDGFERSTKVAHPNTTALIFWLKNRKPREWRDKQELEHSGNVGVKIVDDIQ
ncbi:transposase [Paenibacillus sp. FSL K6-1217]|uniref:transposase n=1 Tax=Paenibacillus sp. FSL K6-1217 TaxID=2921466 RepID=UPI00324F4914